MGHRDHDPDDFADPDRPGRRRTDHRGLRWIHRHGHRDEQRPDGAPRRPPRRRVTDQQSPPAQLVVDVTIKGGEVTPTNEPLQGAVGEPIVIRVNSDAADQLHVHSNPEHTFTVEPKNGQSFQFTVDVPGKVDVELHHLDKTVATITVQ